MHNILILVNLIQAFHVKKTNGTANRVCIVSFSVLFFFCVLCFLVSLIFKKSYQFIPFIVCCSVTFLVELQDAVLK